MIQAMEYFLFDFNLLLEMSSLTLLLKINPLYKNHQNYILNITFLRISPMFLIDLEEFLEICLPVINSIHQYLPHLILH